MELLGQRGIPTDLDSIPSPREGYEPGPDLDPLPLTHQKPTMASEGGDGDSVHASHFE